MNIIACIKEFRNEFNSCNGNNVNSSINSHAISFVLIDSAIDSYKHTCPVAIRHKDKDNMIIITC